MMREGQVAIQRGVKPDTRRATFWLILLVSGVCLAVLALLSGGVIQGIAIGLATALLTYLATSIALHMLGLELPEPVQRFFATKELTDFGLQAIHLRLSDCETPELANQVRHATDFFFFAHTGYLSLAIYHNLD